MGSQETLQKPGSPAGSAPRAPTPTQRRQACSLAVLVAGSGFRGAWPGAGGAPAAHHPLPMLYRLRMEHPSACPPHHATSQPDCLCQAPSYVP